MNTKALTTLRSGDHPLIADPMWSRNLTLPGLRKEVDRRCFYSIPLEEI
jgi:hypothetical protein